MALVLALEQQNLQAGLALLSTPARLRLKGELKRRVQKIKEALDARLEVKGDSAKLRYGSGGKIQLYRENGQWRILEIDWP